VVNNQTSFPVKRPCSQHVRRWQTGRIFISGGYLEECSDFIYRFVYKNFPLLFFLHKHYMSGACLLFHEYRESLMLF